MKIIDVDVLLAQMQEYYEKRAKEAHMTGDRVVCVTWHDAVFLIKSAPTADAVLVRHGKWIKHNTYHGDDVSGFIDPDWRCSECGRQANVNAWFMYDLTDYCPNCGAKMDEKSSSEKKKKDYFPKGFFSKERPIAKGEIDYDR